ncbi:MAG: GGDEF domain-containing protein [Sandaracinaceae bacterium]|nr:GGDEF domain-containing protein [Sandaracinaceae bacterium]
MSHDLRETLTADLARALDANRALVARNARLTSGLSLLARLGGLSRSGDDRRATACAVLTGVPAGVGLAMNRAFVLVPDDGGSLVLLAAVGPVDRADADRVWRAIERDAPTLETLYESGVRALAEGSALDRHLVGASTPRESRGARTLRRADGSSFELDGPTLLEASLGGATGGLLLADNAFTGRTPDDETRLLFTLVASLAGPALEAAERFEAVAREATTDALTGLASRRTGDAILRETCDRALLEGRSVALLLIDLDDFKRVNDTLGHPAGDAVLRAIGARVREALPPSTRAFRYGGEELAVVCDGLGSADAQRLATRLLEAVRGTPVELPSGPLHVRASIGVAATRGASAEHLLDRTDEALLRAKRAGKDRVELAS